MSGGETMFCEKCGSRIPDNSRFCENCGAPVPGAAGEAQGETAPRAQQVTESIYLCPDGMYRWTYEYDMVRNPVILLTVWKVMGMAFVVVFGLIILMGLVEGNGFALPAWDDCKYAVMCYAILFGPVVVIAYAVVAQSYGWRYMVLFEMNDDGVKFIQMKSQFKKAQAMGWLAVMAGLASGNLSTAGAGMLAASRDSMYSEFAKVRAVISKRRFHTIKVNGRLQHNQVYAEDADYDFVLNYIEQHTPQAKHG